MNFTKKLENIWFYYKYYIIAGIVAILMFSIAFSSCANRTPHDINVLYLTHGYVDTSGALEMTLSEYASDTDGDGKKSAQVITISYGTTVKEAQSAGAARAANLAAGKNVLLMVDEQNYNELKSAGFLQPLTSLGSSKYLESDRFDISSAGILNGIDGFQNDSSKYYLCVRTYDEHRASKHKDYKEQYSAAQEFMKNVITVHN